jgi:hypothetical protein
MRERDQLAEAGSLATVDDAPAPARAEEPSCRREGPPHGGRPAGACGDARRLAPAPAILGPEVNARHRDRGLLGGECSSAIPLWSSPNPPIASSTSPPGPSVRGKTKPRLHAFSPGVSSWNIRGHHPTTSSTPVVEIRRSVPLRVRRETDRMPRLCSELSGLLSRSRDRIIRKLRSLARACA